MVKMFDFPFKPNDDDDDDDNESKVNDDCNFLMVNFRLISINCYIFVCVIKTFARLMRFILFSWPN